MTDKNKPISASNPPESKGIRTEQVVEQPVIVPDAVKKLTPKPEKTTAEILLESQKAMENVEGSHVNFTQEKKSTKKKGS